MLNSKKEENAMFKNKKIAKLAVLSLAALFALTACDEESSEIYSKPSDYNDKIVTIDGSSEDIHHNVLSIIYDAIHEGTLASEVLDSALYSYASSVFGYYNKTTLPEGSEEITLKEAAADARANGGYAIAYKFIKAHKAYWHYNDNNEHIINGQVVKDGEDWTPDQTELDHVTAKWDAVENRIAEAMYAKVSSGSYATKNYYSEKEFLRSLHEDGKDVIYDAAAEEDKFIIPYTVEEGEAFDEIDGYDGQKHIIIHRELYQTSILDAAPVESRYIEDEVIPTVYSDLLVEQYLLDEDVAAVRNSRARKINVIKIEKYSSFTNNADLLVKELVKEIYALPEGTDLLETNADVIEAKSDALFEKYSIIAKGLYSQIQDNDEAKAIVETLHGLASDVYEEKELQGEHFYTNTTYGDLVKDYDKILSADSYALLSNTKYSTFTSSGTRSVKEGFEQQKIDIMQTENITKGWYIQSSTPTLDSNGEINDRLFKLSIANAKIELEDNTSEGYIDLVAADRLHYANGVWAVRDEASAFENKFLCSINGSYFLKFEGKSASDDWKNDIVYDDGSAYYICQVLEAAKDSKLRNTSSTNYAHTRGQEFMDEVIDEIAKIVGDTGNYSTLSRNHWLEKMDIKYHDQVVYDYFKSNYPDLFD